MRKRRWVVLLTATAGAVVTTIATGTAYVFTHAGNQPMPTGVHQVEIYTIDDRITTTVPADQRPGVLGRFIGMCDADSYYIEVGGQGQCVSLDGSLGTVPATGTEDGVELSPDAAATVRQIVSAEDAGNQTRSTRVILSYDGGWAGLVEVADLDAGGTVTGRVIH